MPQEHVVVIGGGLAGLEMTQKLEKALSESSHRITLITPRDYLYYNIGSPRVLTQKQWQNSLIAPIKPSLQYATLKSGVLATKVDGKAQKVELNNGEAVEYDKLIVAIGSQNHWPWKLDGMTDREELRKRLDELYDQVKKAKTIAVIGGGAVGCEVVGEIVEAYPDKKVTLIDSGSQILAYPDVPKFRHRVTSILTAKSNISLRTSTRVTSPDIKSQSVFTDTTLELSNGDNMKVDLAIVTAGMTVNQLTGIPTEDDKGHVKINKETLQIDSFPSNTAWAIGDCINVDGPVKLYAYTRAHVDFVAKAVAGKQKHAFKQPLPEVVMLLTLGPGKGAAVMKLPILGPTILPTLLVTTVKADFAACKYMKEHDLKAEAST